MRSHTSQSIAHRSRSHTGDCRVASLALICLILGSLAAGCGRDGCAQSPQTVAAQVGDEPVTCEELELYLALNLFAEENADPSVPEGLDRVKSRLLDALIDEKTFLVEAERRGLSVSDAEVDPYLTTDSQDGAVGPKLSLGRRRLLVRQRLTVLKLQESIAVRLQPPSDEDILAFARRSRGRPGATKRLRLRALRFDSMDDAVQAAARIHQGRISFAEAVVTYETDAGQGVPLELSWEGLSDDVRAALEDLTAGEVSEPVEFHGDTFLFQLEAWLTDPSDLDAERIRDVRDELERQRLQQASDRLLRELRGATPVRIHTKRLPFRYIPESGT